MNISPYQLAQRYVGVHELAGPATHPLIEWWHSLCTGGFEEQDETAWCSSFVNGIAWELRLPRSKSRAARSWLRVGVPVPAAEAVPGWDVVVLWRGSPDSWMGHVGWFAGWEGEDKVLVLGGNQQDAVGISAFKSERILGIRRLVA